MRRLPAVVLLALLPPATGCNLYQLAIHNATNEPLQRHNSRELVKGLQLLGEEVFAEMARLKGESYSEDYRTGFVDGFADYLDAGGTGEPPAVPPLRYRRNKYFTPEGQDAVRDWFAGFRHGSAVAMASGKRRLLLVPIATPPFPDPLEADREQRQRRNAAAAQEKGPKAEEMPPPKPAEAPEPPAKPEPEPEPGPQP